jgi:hypothetical protein
MPRYSKSQLQGFVADRRYWDRKHPEHKAHLDFTVKAFEETYPDPIAPTKEQEEWAAQEEKRLRQLAFRPAYSNKRDPDHARAVAEVHRGFDKINAVLYGTPDPDEADQADASDAPAKTPDPLDPVMPGAARSKTWAFVPPKSLLEPAAQLARSGVSPSNNPSLNARSQTVDRPPRFGVSFATDIRETPPVLAENAPRPNPPKVIHPEISAPPGIDGSFIWSPKMVTPSQIETLWRDLEDPKSAFETFKKGFEHEGARVPDPATGELRPPTEKELEIWFQQWLDDLRDFLQDYYEKKDSLFPDEGDRVPPLMPIQPENPVG